MKTQILIAACTAAFLASGAFVSTGNAAASATMKACSTQWAAMKTAGTVPAGQKWNDFLKTCAANSNAAATTPAAAPVAKAKPVVATPAAAPVAQAAPAAAVKPTLASKLKKLATSAAAPAPATAAAPAAASATGGTAGEQSRIQQCSAKWKTAKSSNTVPAGQTWPQFWSACDARLKAGG